VIAKSLTALVSYIVNKAGAPTGTIHTHSDGFKYKKDSSGDWIKLNEKGEDTSEKKPSSEIEKPEDESLNQIEPVKRKETDKNGNKRVMYEPNEKQKKRWAEFKNDPPKIPSDDEFKEKWKQSHHGKEIGWGMEKQKYMLAILRQHPNYELGIGQGRVDAHRGLDYAEERDQKTYNLGYHLGFTEYQSNRNGWDDETKKKFDEKYGNKNA
jgi:hypothetical protein